MIPSILQHFVDTDVNVRGNPPGSKTIDLPCLLNLCFEFRQTPQKQSPSAAPARGLLHIWRGQMTNFCFDPAPQRPLPNQ
jgi:hypothetical protein